MVYDAISLPVRRVIGKCGWHDARPASRDFVGWMARTFYPRLTSCRCAFG
jgi:hypothetical protein